MNKNELIEKASVRTGLTKKDCAAAIGAMTEAITQELQRGGKIQLSGFGVFEVKHREARRGRDPRTKATVAIEARDVPVFRPGKLLKDAVSRNRGDLVF